MFNFTSIFPGSAGQFLPHFLRPWTIYVRQCNAALVRYRYRARSSLLHVRGGRNESHSPSVRVICRRPRVSFESASMVSLFRITLSMAVIFVCVLLTADILRFIAIYFFPKQYGKIGKADTKRCLKGRAREEGKGEKLIAAEICQNLPLVITSLASHVCLVGTVLELLQVDEMCEGPFCA